MFPSENFLWLCVLVSSIRIPMQMVYAAASTSVHFQATVSIKRAQSVI